MKKLLNVLLVLMMLISVQTTSIFAEGEVGSSIDNPITDNTSLALRYGENNVVMLQPNGSPSFFQNGRIKIHFIQGEKDYIYQATQKIGFALRIVESNFSSSEHSTTLPAGTYEVLFEKLDYNNNTTSYYKFVDSNGSNTVTMPAMFSEVPAANSLVITNVITSDGYDDGFNIACANSDDAVCQKFLTALVSGNSGEYIIKDENDNRLLGGSTNGIVQESDGLIKLSNHKIVTDAYGSFSDIENKKITIEFRNVAGFVGTFNKDLDNVKIMQKPGSFGKPFDCCQLIKDTATGSNENAYIISCNASDNTILTSDFTDVDNRSLLLYALDDNKNQTGTAYRLDMSKTQLSTDGKQLYFDTTSFLETKITIDGYTSTHVPADDYDVYLQKLEKSLKPDTGVYYKLNYGSTNYAPFTRIKNPTQEFEVVNDENNNILIQCKDGDRKEECKDWLGFLKDEFARTSSKEVTYIDFISRAGDHIKFHEGSSNLNNLEYVLDSNNKVEAIKIDANQLASMGFKSENGSEAMLYEVHIYAKAYATSLITDFTPNVTIKDPTPLVSQLTLTQGSKEDLFEITITAGDKESFEYLKNTRIAPQKVSPQEGLGSLTDGVCDEEKLQCTYPTLFSEEDTELDVNIVLFSDGYEHTFFPNNNNPEVFKMKFIDTEVVTHNKVIFSTSGIQIFSDNQGFLQTLTGEKVVDYPHRQGMQLTIYESSTNTAIATISDHFIYGNGKEVGGGVQSDKAITYLDPNTNETHTLKYYVQVDNPELAEVDFDPTKAYIFSFTFPYDYNYGSVETSPIRITNEYFKGLSKDGYSGMSDEENLNILGVILGVDANDNNPNTIKKIYKNIQKSNKAKDLGVDMPEVVGAIIEHENQEGGFSKENIQYIGANEVELGISFEDLDEADLEEGFKEFDVTKTDVGFDVTLTNKYFKDGNELKDDHITELPKSAVVTFNLPDGDLKEGQEYMLLTVHNGKAKLIPVRVEKDSNGKKIGYAEVSEFSPFQLVVQDKETTKKPSSNGGYVVVNTAAK